MYRANDPAVIKNTEQRAQWRKDNPGDTWKRNLSPQQIEDIEIRNNLGAKLEAFTPQKTTRDYGKEMLESAKHIDYDY